MRPAILTPPAVVPDITIPIASPRRAWNQLAITNAAGANVPAEMPTPSSE